MTSDAPFHTLGQNALSVTLIPVYTLTKRNLDDRMGGTNEDPPTIKDFRDRTNAEKLRRIREEIKDSPGEISVRLGIPSDDGKSFQAVSKTFTKFCDDEVQV